MRNNDPIFWPEGSIDTSIRMSMEKNYTDCINILQTQWYQADLDQRFAMGDQDIWGLIFPGVATYRRKIFNFNLINAQIQMISGYQRRNRKSTECIAVHSPVQKTADILTKCLFYVHGNSGYQIYSDAFEQGALTQGLGWVGIYKDTSCDPISGDIKLKYIDMKSCLFDPYFRRTDASDMRFFWTRTFYDRHEAAVLHPEIGDQIMSMGPGTYRDDKFYYMPEVYQIQFPNLIAFDEYWYLTSRPATYLVDTKTNETQEFNGSEDDLNIIMRTMGKKLAVIKKPKPTVRRSVILNDRLVIDEANPYKIDRYPYVPFLGYFTPDTAYYAYKFRGVVRDLRDCQYLFNRRKVADLDILESQQQGLKVKKGALVTPTDALNQGHGRVLTIDSHMQMSDVEQMDIHPPSPVMIQMEQMLSDTMQQISGVTDVMLGKDIDDKAGIISMLAHNNGISTLQRLFDQFDGAQRQCGEIICEMIQKNWTYGKIKQVTGEEPSAEFDNKLFFKYGCKVVQGVLTETQQQMEMAKLLNLKEILGDMMPNDEIIEVMQIQNKDRIIEKIQANQKAASEKAEKIEALQMEQMRVENRTKDAYSESQLGLADERRAKIQLDKALNVERIQRAEEDKSAAVLNLVKAVKELQTIDLNQISQYLDIVHRLEGEQDADATKIKQQPVEQSKLKVA